MSERNAEQTSGEPGSLSAGPAVPNSLEARSEPAAVAAAPEPAKETPDAGSPDLVPEQGAAAETSEVSESKAEAPKADAPRTAGKVMIMSSGDRGGWKGNGAGPEAESAPSQGMFGKRRLAAMAAVVALATVAGALGGALATAGIQHFLGDDAASAGTHALEASVARIDADMLTMKASVEHTSKMGMSQFNKTSDRLDRVERAQLEPAAKLAKLSEAVDKLRAAPPVASAAVAAASAPVAAKEVTASITPAAVAAPADTPKGEVARLPTVEGWVLRGVANGIALIESRRGIYEVYAGDLVPGAGRVDAIRRQDGRWVVVTSKGLIVGR